MNKKEARNLKYLRSKAVKDAWAREVKLVKQGKATRNWTLDEQRELLLTGRIKGYIGHHIKSVKLYSNYAGEEKNIQFLTRKEHFKVHFGNWKNSVCNYYDAETKSIKLLNYEGLSLTQVSLREKLSEQEKLELYKLKKEGGSTMLPVDYENEFNQLTSSAKNRIMSIFERNKNQSVSEIAGAFSRELPHGNLSAEEAKNNIFMPMAYDLKNNKTDFVDAFSERVATDTMKNKYDSITRSTSNGTTKIDENYQKFANSRAKACESNVAKSSLDAGKTGEALEKGLKKAGQITQAELQKLKADFKCAKDTVSLYASQQEKWQMSSSEGKSLDNTHNQGKTNSVSKKR